MEVYAKRYQGNKQNTRQDREGMGRGKAKRSSIIPSQAGCRKEAAVAASEEGKEAKRSMRK